MSITFVIIRCSLVCLFFCFFILGNLYAYSGNCSFVGNNTAYALQHTQSLISKLKELRDREGCNISERSIEALGRVNKYFSFYLNDRNYEQVFLGYTAELEQFQLAYEFAVNEKERKFWMNKIIEVKANQTVTKAQMSINRHSSLMNTPQYYSVQDVTREIGYVVDDAGTLNECFMNAPQMAAGIISNMVNLTGSIASVATANPIWGSVGNIVGNLISTLTTYITKYKWDKYINRLDQKVLYHSLLCMIEMQSNFYCEKNDEINVIKGIMKKIATSDSSLYNEGEWEGYKIEAQALPVIQNWIKNIYQGLPPSSEIDAQEQNNFLSKINAVEMIQNQVLAKYKNIEENFRQGDGDKLSILYNGVKDVAALLGGYFPGIEGIGPTNGTDSADNNLTKLGQQYFTTRYLPVLIPFILITPPTGEILDNIPALPPSCPRATPNCPGITLFLNYLKEKYDISGERIEERILSSVLSVLAKRIEFIFTKINSDINNDLMKRRIRDPEVLLSKAKAPEFLYRTSAEKALTQVSDYISFSIRIIKKYLKYEGTEQDCMQASSLNNIENTFNLGLSHELNRYFNLEVLNRNLFFPLDGLAQGGCPIQLQLAYSTKKSVDEVVFNLKNNMDSAKNRLSNILSILKFSTDKTLFLIARVTEILKADLDARTELGLFRPTEKEMFFLKERDIFEQLVEEQRTSSINYNQAIKEREIAQGVIRDNLNVFVNFFALRDTIVSETRTLARLSSNRGNREYYDKYGETCAVLLSLPFDNVGGRNIISICSEAVAKSEWNRVRTEIGLAEIENLNVPFNQVYNRVGYPGRICTYRNYLRRNAIFGLH